MQEHHKKSLLLNLKRYPVGFSVDSVFNNTQGRRSTKASTDSVRTGWLYGLIPLTWGCVRSDSAKVRNDIPVFYQDTSLSESLSETKNTLRRTICILIKCIFKKPGHVTILTTATEKQPHLDSK